MRNAEIRFTLSGPQADKRDLCFGMTRGAVSINTFEMKTAIHFGADALGRLKEIPYKESLLSQTRLL